MLAVKKLVYIKLYLTVHRFHARVQSSACSAYGKYQRKSIMAVLTPQSDVAPSFFLYLFSDLTSGM